MTKGVEIYTKQAAVAHFPTLEPYLYRKETTADNLIVIFNDFIDYCEKIKYTQQDDIVVFENSTNSYDLKTEIVL